MRIIKEPHHILFRRTLGLNNGLWLSVAVGSFFHLDEPEKTGTSIDLWKLAAETLGKGALLDGAGPKPVGEFFVCGSCWSASGASVASSEVEVSVGSLSKRLTVYGEREWLPPGSESPLRSSEPKPFVSMPVDWAHAHGGEGSLYNPLGLGVKPKPPFNHWPLPNIESGTFNRSASDQTPPAGFGMIGVQDPRRNQNLGTYDQRWLENRWPYFPDDFDTAYFNCAEADQRLKTGFFNPGDPVVIHNMHPARPELRSRLPHLHHRAFIVQQRGDKEVFIEAPLSIDTVWLWPDRERGLVLARGMFPIADDEAEDVKLLFAVTEPLSEPQRPVAECYQELQRRLTRKVPFHLPPQVPDSEAILKAAAAKLALPPDARSESQAAVNPTGAEKIEQEIVRDEAKITALLENPEYGTALQVSALRKSIKSRRASALKQPAMAGQPGISSVLDEFELPSAQMRDQLQQLKTGNPQQYEKLAAELNEADEQTKALKIKLAGVEQHTLDRQGMSPAELLIDTAQDLMQQRDAVLEKLKPLQESLKADGLWTLERHMAHGDLERIDGSLRRAGADMKDIAGDSAQKNEKLAQLIEIIARLPEPAATPKAKLDIAALMEQITQEQIAETQATLNAQMPAGVKAPDLAAEYQKALKIQAEAGFDPSAELSKTLDELPPEAKAKIPPEELQKMKAMIADAEKRMDELKAKKLDGELDLGKYHPSQKIMTRETTQQRVLGGESLAGCDFTDLDLSGLDLSGGCFDGAQFVRTNLQGTRFNGAELNGARFDAVNAREADFGKAGLEKTLWLNQSVADKACFKQVRASGMKVQGCSFKQSDFSEADLESSVFRQSVLDRAGFHQAQMKYVMLIETGATECDFSATHWRNGVIQRSTIASSSFEDCNSPHLMIWDSDAKALKATNAKLEHFTVGGEKTSLDESCFDDATLTRATQMDISAQRVSARRAVLDRVYFRKVNLSGSDYYGARAPGAQIMRCTLNRVNMGAINLKGGSLRKSGFANADLSASCLYAVEFYQAQFAQTRLDGAFTARCGLTEKQRLAAAQPDDGEKS
jgi:uncharacterized protein YjbI with pentapeptide repeats